VSTRAALGYPEFTDEELRLAQQTFRNYIHAMSRIYERVLKNKGPKLPANWHAGNNR
jgi:hypothetical protein